MLWLLALACAGYLALVALLFTTQRMLLYPGSWDRGGTSLAGLAPPGFADLVVTTEDREELTAWWYPPEPGRAVLLYFQGNGGSLSQRRGRATALAVGGRGVLLLSYRGYSGSTGTPTEEGLAADARAAYDRVRALAPVDAPIVVYGESLGTGVGVRLATERRVQGVVLETPFTSTVDVARRGFWFVPVGLLMKDRFDSASRIERIGAPLLILHGDRDATVPYDLGERLFGLAVAPKRFVPLPGVGHSQILERGGLGPVREFLGEIERGR